MPALTPEQEALKAAAMQFKVHGMFTTSHGRFNELANVDAILALLAQLEAPEAPTSGDIILCGCMPADLGYAPPKLEWEEAPSVPEQAGIDQQAGGESAPQPAESRMDTGLQAGGQVAARGVSTLPSTPLPGSARQPVQPIPDVLFDGMAVYEEITRKLGKGHCISASSVSATLDAVVRLIRAAKAVPGEPGQ